MKYTLLFFSVTGVELVQVSICKWMIKGMSRSIYFYIRECAPSIRKTDLYTIESYPSQFYKSDSKNEYDY